MWTKENRAKYNRDHLRYPSDLTDDEWTLVEPFIPPTKSGGGKRRTDMREVMNGVMYILSTGCQWRYLPKDFPPRSTVHNYFIWWQCDGVLDRINHALYVKCREKAERDASPTACIIDADSDEVARVFRHDVARGLVPRWRIICGIRLWDGQSLDWGHELGRSKPRASAPPGSAVASERLAGDWAGSSGIDAKPGLGSRSE